jgi:hypothetical protein
MIAPKKRGRKPKNEYYLNKKIDKVELERTCIIHLPIKIESSYKENCEREQGIIGDLPNDIIPYETDFINFDSYNKLKETVDDIFISSAVNPINEINNTEYYNLCIIPKEIDTKNINLKIRTDIYCFWCCHPFDTQPVFMPCNLKGDVFYVKGIFCSFECCLSYMSSVSKYSKNIHLLKYMYCKFTNKKFFRETLSKAPDRECLKIFGGPLDIADFRNNSNTYKILNNPMCYIPGLMEKASKPQVEVKTKNTSLLSDFIKRI